MRGQWIVEMAELDAFSKSRNQRVRRPSSRVLRIVFGRSTGGAQRPCRGNAFSAGPVNHLEYLIDESGNRRYWPVKCTRVDQELAAERDQLWAEARHRYEKSEPWWVQPEDKPMFDAEAEARYVGDAWESRIRSYLEELDAAGQKRTEASMPEILEHALKLEASRWTRSEQTRVGKIVARIDGWEHVGPSLISRGSTDEWMPVSPRLPWAQRQPRANVVANLT